MNGMTDFMFAKSQYWLTRLRQAQGEGWAWIESARRHSSLLFIFNFAHKATDSQFCNIDVISSVIALYEYIFRVPPHIQWHRTHFANFELRVWGEKNMENCTPRVVNFIQVVHWNEFLRQISKTVKFNHQHLYGAIQQKHSAAKNSVSFDVNWKRLSYIALLL